MPIINGQKMACGPCIRGHRSTKCNHANERLMVPVRKPGRPLSICPHPPSRPCGCGVTAAIPRKQACHCGTSSSTDDDGAPIATTSSPEEDPATPTKSSSAPYRIHKPSKSTSRKQSYDPSTLERVDPSHLNIVPSSYDPSRHPQILLQHGSAVPPGPNPNVHSSFPPLAMIPGADQIAPLMYPLYPGTQQLPTPLPSDTSDNRSDGLSTAAAIGAPTPMSPKSRALSTSTSTIANGTASPDSVAKVNGGHSQTRKGSCCQPAPESPEGRPSMPRESIPQAGAPVLPMNLAGSFQPYFPHPTLFTYPPHYGSYYHPLRPDEWRQTMQTLLSQSLPNPMQQNIHCLPHGTPNTAAGTSHLCTCGTGCQCVGCAAHPYNEATQDYVRSAYNIMFDESWMANGIAGLQSPVTNGSERQDHSTNGTTTSPVLSAHLSPGATKSEQDLSTTSPAASDTASGASEEQTLPASDYFFVTYEFGPNSCVGDTASCPCGDDCECVGCTVHGIPAPAMDGTTGGGPEDSNPPLEP